MKEKNAIINPRNEDQKCLLWCVRISELLKRTPDLENPSRIRKILKRKLRVLILKDWNFHVDFEILTNVKKIITLQLMCLDIMKKIKSMNFFL